MGFKKYAFIFSGILMLIGIVAFVQINRGEANLGVEFSGGTMAQFKAAQSFRLDKIRGPFLRGALKISNCSRCPTKIF